MATRYKDRITILEDAEIEELYGRPRFTHDERVHYFALTPEERAVADGHYSLVSRVLFILQAGYFKAKTLFFWNCTTITLAPVPSVQHWVRKPIRWSESRPNRSTFSRLWCNTWKPTALVFRGCDGSKPQLLRISLDSGFWTKWGAPHFVQLLLRPLVLSGGRRIAVRQEFCEAFGSSKGAS